MPKKKTDVFTDPDTGERTVRNFPTRDGGGMDFKIPPGDGDAEIIQKHPPGGGRKSSSAFTLFATLDDMLRGIPATDITRFKEGYDSLRSLGPDGVVGSGTNKYGVLQLDHVLHNAGNEAVYSMMGDPAYQRLVDIVYNSPAGAAVTWLFLHPLKGVWQAALAGQSQMLLDDLDYLDSLRQRTAESTDVREQAFYRGTERQVLEENAVPSQGIIYKLASRYQGRKNLIRNSTMTDFMSADA